jgi:hypothetical protein
LIVAEELALDPASIAVEMAPVTERFMDHDNTLGYGIGAAYYATWGSRSRRRGGSPGGACGGQRPFFRYRRAASLTAPDAAGLYLGGCHLRVTRLRIQWTRASHRES